jgi:hypothetical protein
VFSGIPLVAVPNLPDIEAIAKQSIKSTSRESHSSESSPGLGNPDLASDLVPVESFG